MECFVDYVFLVLSSLKKMPYSESGVWDKMKSNVSSWKYRAGGGRRWNLIWMQTLTLFSEYYMILIIVIAWKLQISIQTKGRYLHHCRACSLSCVVRMYGLRCAAVHCEMWVLQKRGLIGLLLIMAHPLLILLCWVKHSWAVQSNWIKAEACTKSGL